jgi:hypothetical protein
VQRESPSASLVAHALPPRGPSFHPRETVHGSTSQKEDRHRAGSVQVKLWVGAELKNDLMSVCSVQGVTPSDVLRGLLAAYVAGSSGRQYG